MSLLCNGFADMYIVYKNTSETHAIIVLGKSVMPDGRCDMVSEQNVRE